MADIGSGNWTATEWTSKLPAGQHSECLQMGARVQCLTADKKKDTSLGTVVSIYDKVRGALRAPLDPFWLLQAPSEGRDFYACGVSKVRQ